MIRKWLEKSFSRQVTAMLLLVGIVSNSTYALFEFYQEHRHYKNFMEQQATQLSKTLGQTLGNDVHYENYFALWSSIRKVYLDNQASNKDFDLIIINEIAVINKEGRVLAHTQAETHKPGSVYSNPLLNDISITDRPSAVLWMEQHNKLFVYSAISYNNSIVGYMIISYSTLPLKALRNRALTTYAISQIAILIFIILIAGYFARKISAPINDIIDALPDMGSGNLDISSLDHRHDEFKTLKKALRHADKSIYETHNEIIDQQQKLSGILDNSDAIIFMKDTEGKYLLVNQRYEKIFRTDQQDVIGRTDFDLHPAIFAQEFLNHDRSVIAAKRPIHFEERIELDDGIHTYITVRFPIKDSSGHIYAIAGIATDITERKQIEKELIQYKTRLESIVEIRTQELKESIQELEAFSYSVSHDLRSPLRSINGFSLALKEDYKDELDDTANNYLDRIIRATDRMGDIIDDLLLLSRVNRHEIHTQTINLSLITEKVFQQLQSLDPDQKIEIDIESNIMIQGDPKLIYLAMENLLGNAWKYTAKAEQPKITFGQTSQNGHKVYFVRDNGTGFDMQYVDKLFKAFQRLHGSEYEGTGIGLATVHRIIHRHNGRIWAESEEGHGATFYFTLGE